jgi:hypothetical protein
VHTLAWGPRRRRMNGGSMTLTVADRTAAAPHVILLDARAEGLDEAELRARAREVAAASPGRFTSRAYRFPFALIASHEAAVGVDIERVEPRDEDFADSIRTPSERMAGWPEDADRFFSSLWSSKEALAKALGDALKYDPRRLEGPRVWPDGRAGCWSAHPLELGQEHVGWVCWRVPGPS